MYVAYPHACCPYAYLNLVASLCRRAIQDKVDTVGQEGPCNHPPGLDSAL